jgi:raffinose/stachyose/melibiose transport system substrate-binding protein
MRQPLLRRRALVAAGVASALAVAAAGCGSGGGGGNADITWWHIQNEDPMRSTWAAMADEWAEESGLSFDIHDIENEAF